MQLFLFLLICFVCSVFFFFFSFFCFAFCFLFLFLFCFVCFLFFLGGGGYKRVFYLNIPAKHPISRFEKHVAISQGCIRNQIVHIVLNRCPMLWKKFFFYQAILIWHIILKITKTNHRINSS